MVRTPFASLALACLLGASGCSTEDAAPTSGNDTGSAETDSLDSSAPDSGSLDSGPGDGSAGDSGAGDSAMVDASSYDTGGSTDADAAEISEAGDTGLSDGASVPDGACKTGTVEETTCGKCGKHSRLCDGGGWLDYGACYDESGSCVPAETRSVPCGRCGTRKQTCSSTCEWTSDVCVGEKACVAGTTETQYGTCLDSTKVKTRTCSDGCVWSEWSACT